MMSNTQQFRNHSENITISVGQPCLGSYPGHPFSNGCKQF